MCQRSSSILLCAGMSLVLAGYAGAGTIVVPSGQAPTIQIAINLTDDTDAEVPDEIVVMPGTYFESIDLLGKTLQLRSSDGPEVTVIDALGQLDQAVHCISGEGPDTIIEGFTIRNGDGTHAFPDDRGGGLYVDSSSPTVRNCVFTMNDANTGGALYSNAGSPAIERCVFFDNFSVGEGGAVYLNNSDGTQITDCEFTANEATNNGGAISNHTTEMTIRRSQFRSNTAGLNGHGIWTVNLSSTMTIVNSLFDDQVQAFYNGDNATVNVWNCTSTDEFVNTSSSTMNVTNCIVWNAGIDSLGTETVTYSIVQGGYPGTGNLDVDPMFVDEANGDLRIPDASPAVDAGNALAAVAVFDQYPVDLAGDPRVVDAPAADTGIAVFGETIDLGAYEVQSGPSASCPWDSNGDDIVGVEDFLGVLANWGGCP